MEIVTMIFISALWVYIGYSWGVDDAKRYNKDIDKTINMYINYAESMKESYIYYYDKCRKLEQMNVKILNTYKSNKEKDLVEERENK